MPRTTFSLRLLSLRTLALAIAALALSCLTPRPLPAQIPTHWVWIGGNPIPSDCGKTGNCGYAGTYGTKYQFSNTNIPGGRSEAVSWSDENDRFWLFGGYGFGAVSTDIRASNDLWVFDPALGAHGQWAWVGGGGNTQQGAGAVFGTKYQFAATNVPGGRFGAVAWTGKDGKHWIFGGEGFDTVASYKFLNDLWAFDPTKGAHGEWAWMSGSSKTDTYGGQKGVYGTKYQFADANTPGSREYAVSWTDKSGKLWLFGGYGYDSIGHADMLNDLWVFDPAKGTHGEWAWMGGSNTIPFPCGLAYCGQSGLYGTQYQFDAANIPGARDRSVAWTDTDGKLWLFGGSGFDSLGLNSLDDLWAFDPSAGAHGEWAWMGGDKTGFNSGSYISEYQFTATGAPGDLDSASAWTGENNRFWMLHEYGISTLWAFDPDLGDHGEWAWMSGSHTSNNIVYGQHYVPSTANTPGGRDQAATWIDKAGHLWLFGGTRLVPTSIPNSYYTATLNDLWEFAIPKPQTITFPQPATPVTYGAKPITLKATGGVSGNPVTFKVLSGPGKVSGTNGSTLTFTGAGTVVVAANQTGNLDYAAAPQVTHSIVVNKAPLTVTADNKTMKQGASIPASTYTATGFVNGDTAAKALTGHPIFFVSASSNKTVGLYTITITAGTLKAANYAFTFKNGTLLITGAVVQPAFSLKAGSYKGAQKLTLSTTTPGASIYFTTDGSTPSATHGTKYTTTLTISKTTTVKAIAALTGCTPSPVATAAYTIK